MAILPVHQMLDRDDTLGAVQRGLVFGQQHRDRTDALADRQTLRELTPGALAGDPDALARMAAIDPAAAKGADDLAIRQGQKLKNWFDYTDKALQQSRKTGNFAPVNAALALCSHTIGSSYPVGREHALKPLARAGQA